LKKSIVVLITSVVGVILVGVVFLVLGSGEDPLTTAGTASIIPPKNPTSESANSSEPANPQGYQAYDAKVVSETKGDKIIFFHASWCPTCNALDKNIKEGVVPASLTIFKANYDTEKDLKKKYGVTVQHTLVQIDDQGNELNQWLGSLTIGQLEGELR